MAVSCSGQWPSVEAQWAAGILPWAGRAQDMARVLGSIRNNRGLERCGGVTLYMVRVAMGVPNIISLYKPTFQPTLLMSLASQSA